MDTTQDKTNLKSALACVKSETLQALGFGGSIILAMGFYIVLVLVDGSRALFFGSLENRD